MNYKILSTFIIFFLTSCAEIVHEKKINTKPQKSFFTNTGFALIYESSLYKKKIVSNKIDNRSLIIFQRNLKKNTNVRITNLSNSKYIIAKVGDNSDYPFFYNSVISDRISKELNLNINEPYIEIREVLPGSTFVAKKTITFDEEKNVAIKVPIENIEIKDLSENKKKNITLKKNYKFNYIIKVADFYFLKSAKLMKSRVLEETTIKKVKIKKISNTNYRVFIGPYDDLNSLKKSFNAINVLEFENLEVIKI